MTLTEQRDIIQAAIDGKTVEIYNPETDKWVIVDDTHKFNFRWNEYRYRIAPEQPEPERSCETCKLTADKCDTCAVIGNSEQPKQPVKDIEPLGELHIVGWNDWRDKLNQLVTAVNELKRNTK